MARNTYGRAAGEPRKFFKRISTPAIPARVARFLPKIVFLRQCGSPAHCPCSSPVYSSVACNTADYFLAMALRPLCYHL